MGDKDRHDGVVVIGLGRFGSSLAIELAAGDTEVLGIDNSDRIVQQLSGQLTHVARADSTDIEALRQLGVDQFRRAVVAIGTDLESSILTTSLLVDLGVEQIWAKAVSREHATILQRVGAGRVVLPEHEMGERVAHLVMGRMLDFFELDEGFAIVKTAPPARALGKPLGESRIRADFGVTVVSIKKRNGDFAHATAETIVEQGDTLIVAGPTKKAERFANLA